MAARKLLEGVYEVGALHWDRRLFDELIPLPDGTSYNSYLVKGKEKTALVDTVDPSKEKVLMKNLDELGVEKLDYLVSNHAEQDHSGSIPSVLERYSDSKLVTNEKCAGMLVDLGLASKDRIRTVQDGETLSLGGRTFEFVLAPWVHWPETMFTFLKEDKLLFSCDFLGSHLAASDLLVEDESEVYEAAKRYYAEIMMPFRSFDKQHLEKIRKMGVEVVAPSHGPVYDNPEFILKAYEDWTGDETKNQVIIPFVSMHGSTLEMVEHLEEALIRRGVTVKMFNLTETDVGELAMALVDAATVILGSPTMLVGPHPSSVYAAYLVNALRPKTRYVGVVGSYGWGGTMLSNLKDLMKNLSAEFLEPVVIKGRPGEKDFEALDKLADRVLEKHEKDPLVKTEKLGGGGIRLCLRK